MCKGKREGVKQVSSLKRAIEMANESGHALINTPPEEWKKTIEFMREKGSCIEVNGSCYAVKFYTA